MLVDKINLNSTLSIIKFINTGLYIGHEIKECHRFFA